jgi:hypothetical protein
MLTPRNLALGYGAQDLGRADQECINLPANEVRPWLMGSAQLGTMVGLPDRTKEGRSIDAYGFESCWLARAAVAYGKTRLEWQPRDRIEFERWLLDQAYYLAAMTDRHLSVLWPLRANRDYTKQGAATVGSSSTMPDGRPVPWSAQFYNNRRAQQVLALGLVGIILGDDWLMNTAVTYVQEWVMHAVWPDGLCADWERCGERGLPMQGVMYACVNAAVALELAMRLESIGDLRLVNFAHQRRTVWTAGDRLAALWDGSQPVALADGTQVEPTAPGPAGVPMQWSFLLPAYFRYGRAGMWAGRNLTSTGDYYWRPMAGVAGIHASLTTTDNHPK